ncbi:MAG: LuxR C-terminal-related transcriptional regulator [Verrucomicrobiota bacterium]
MKLIKIVIVEDQILLRSFWSCAFKRDKRLKLIGAFSTEGEAFSSCPKLRPDIIIADIVLSEGSGINLIRRLKPLLPRTKFLAISGYENPDFVKDAVEVGAHGFVFKNTHWKTAVDVIFKIAGGKEHFDEKSLNLLKESLQHGKDLKKKLTVREKEILKKVAEGEAPKAIAHELKLSVKTVHNHVTNLKKKLKIHEVAGLVRYAIHCGLALKP